MAKSNVLLERFFEVARHDPHRVACICGGESLTYGQLLDKVHNAATALHSMGIVKGDLVFVALDNSLEVPIVYFAAMWLGAVFIPVNPAWPQGRREEVIRHIAPKIVVVQHSEDRDDLPSCNLIGVNELVSSGHSLPRPSVAPVGGRDLIYGFFTSGSTGVPKCALNCYEGLENRFNFMSETFFTSRDALVVLQNSRVSFDSSIWQLIWPLTMGGTVVIRRSRDLMDFEEVLDDIADHRVAMTDFVPSVLSEFVRYIAADPLRSARIGSMRNILVGGEAINARDVATLKSLAKGLDVFNTYGPTEASIGMMFHQVVDVDNEYIPIGRPIPNTHAFIMDEHGNVLSDGEMGEIVIGGKCIGHGYLKDDEMTGKCFIPDPLTSQSGALAFKTGNIGFRDSAGIFHYRGRQGDQIKINGIRLELGEVESVALTLAGVRKAKAALNETAERSLLICFLEGDNLDLDKARRHFREHLPREAWPRRIEALTSFPINDNGKTDVSALLQQYRLNEKRKAIHDLVAEVLGVGPIKADQDLIELGANSLDAYVLCSAVKERLGIDVWPPALLKNFRLSTLWAFNEGEKSFVAPAVSQKNLRALVSHDCRSAIFSLRPSSGARRAAVVTGATGYVGLHLLRALMHMPRYSKIICLVRRDPQGALALVQEKFKLYDLPITDSYWDKLEFISVDLRREDMGLSTGRLKAVAAQCADVYALASQVSMAATYDVLRQENVDTLKSTLALAALCAAPIRYLSTSTLNKWRLNEDRVSMALRLSGEKDVSGYDLSKLVCEHQLEDYRNQGGGVTCLRVGEILPDIGGVENLNAILTHLCALFQATGCAPLVDIRFDGISIELVIDALLAGRNTIGALGLPITLSDYLRLHHPQLPFVSAEHFLVRARAVELTSAGTRYVRDVLTSLGSEQQLAAAISEHFLGPYCAYQATTTHAPRRELSTV